MSRSYSIQMQRLATVVLNISTYCWNTTIPFHNAMPIFDYLLCMNEFKELVTYIKNQDRFT